jgi:O-antigen/teichoic acid export membrane protein
MVEDASADPPAKATPAATPVSLSGSVGLIGLSNGVALGAGLVRQKIFAVFLGPVGVGALSLASAFFELLITLARMGVPTGLLREASRALAVDESSRVARAYRDSTVRVLTVAAAVFVICVLFAIVIHDRLFNKALPLWTAPLLAVSLPFLVVAQLREALLSAHGKVARLAASKIIVTLASLAATAVLVAVWGLGGAVAQIAVGAVVAGGVTAIMLRPGFVPRRGVAKSVDPDEAREAARRIFQVGGAEALFHIGVTLNLLLFRSLIVSGLGLEANGLYQVVLGLSRQYVPAILGGVFVALYPRLSALSDQLPALAKERAQALRYVFALGVPLALGLLATRDWLIAVVLTDEFAAAEGLFRWTAPGDVLILLGGVLQISLLAQGTARRFVFAGLLSEAIYLSLFIGLRGYGLDGAAAAYLFGAAVAVGVFAHAQRLTLFGIVRDVGVGRCLLGAGLVAAAAALPWGVTIARWAVLAVAFAWLWSQRQLLLHRSQS